MILAEEPGRGVALVGAGTANTEAKGQPLPSPLSPTPNPLAPPSSCDPCDPPSQGPRCPQNSLSAFLPHAPVTVG